MALTAFITTRDGIQHPNVHALIYPVEIRTLPGDYLLRITVHAWHDKTAHDGHYNELEGFPMPVQLQGEAAEAAIINGLSSLPFSDPPDSSAIKEAFVAALENVVVTQDSRFAAGD